MKIFLTVFLGLLAVAAAFTPEEDKKFDDYVNRYDIRLPRSGSLNKRKATYLENLKNIENHNLRYQSGKEIYELEENAFTLYDHDEFVALRTGALPKNRTNEPAPEEKNRRGRITPPAAFDWRSTPGVVQPIQNQGSCGSCWAHAGIAAIEGRMKIQKGISVKLSEQEIIECARNPWTGALLGCKGGWDFATYNHVKANGDTSSAYRPFRAVDYTGCNTGTPRIDGAKVATYYDIPAGDEVAMKSYLVNYGPLYTTMYVSSYFYSYRSGVYTDSYGQCNPGYYNNHAVVIVGYGTENGRDYWTVRNSWGTNFGEQGYFRILRGRNLCGIAKDASFVVLA